MTTQQEAAEQLRVIRSMMERATIFRALSGETALVGGAVSIPIGPQPGRAGNGGGRLFSGASLRAAFHREPK